MAKQHSVKIRIDGDNPEAVEFFRLLILGQLEDHVASEGKTTISNRDKYAGNGLAYMTAIVSDETLETLRKME